MGAEAGLFDALWVQAGSPSPETLLTLKLLAGLACFAHWRISTHQRRLELEKAEAVSAHAD